MSSHLLKKVGAVTLFMALFVASIWALPLQDGGGQQGNQNQNSTPGVPNSNRGRGRNPDPGTPRGPINRNANGNTNGNANTGGNTNTPR